MNLFEGLDTHAIQSVLVAVLIFTAASGLAFAGLAGFGVRSGIVVPKATRALPPAGDAELLAFLAAGLCGLISDFGAAFLGPAENLLDIPTFLPLSVGPLVPGSFLFFTAVTLAIRTIRRGRAGAN